MSNDLDKIFEIQHDWVFNDEEIDKIVKILTPVCKSKSKSESTLDLKNVKKKLEQEYNLEITMRNLLIVMLRIDKKEVDYFIEIENIILKFPNLPF